MRRGLSALVGLSMLGCVGEEQTLNFTTEDFFTGDLIEWECTVFDGDMERIVLREVVPEDINTSYKISSNTILGRPDRHNITIIDPNGWGVQYVDVLQKCRSEYLKNVNQGILSQDSTPSNR